MTAEWRNTRNILNTEYMEYSKTQNKRQIVEQGYTCIQSAPVHYGTAPVDTSRQFMQISRQKSE